MKYTGFYAEIHPKYGTGYTVIERSFEHAYINREKAEEEALRSTQYNAWKMGFHDYTIRFLTLSS